MSKDNENKNEFEGDTFSNIIKESMHKGSNVHTITQLLDSFDDKQKQQVLDTVQGLSSVVDKLKLLVARTQKQESKDG